MTSNRQVQSFVGGAIAVIGFRALFWIPYGFAVRDSVYILAGVAVGLGLPLGVDVLRERAGALRVAEVYLALGILVMSSVFAVFRLGVLPDSAPRVSWWSLSDLLIPAVLLTLLLWGRMHHKAKSVEPDGAGNSRCAGH